MFHEKEKGNGGGGGAAGRLVPPAHRPVPRITFPVVPLGRKWLKIDAEGKSQIVATDRHRLTHELGVQTRDLRILDPKFSTNYPSAILCREKAIVVNLLHIKAIVTSKYVLVMNPETQDGELDPFVRELENRLSKRDIPPSSSFPVLSILGQKKTGKTKDNNGKGGKAADAKSGGDASDAQEPVSGNERPQEKGPTVTPFELKAVEVCLESICTIMDANTTSLEGTAFPAVDDLTLHVSTKNLQRVRSVKSKIAQLKTRVETVKEVLEKFLDDDNDMRSMNLTAKEQLHRSYNSSIDLVPRPDPFGSFHETEQTPLLPPPPPPSSSSSSSSDVDEAVQEVEMLLEAYFMQLDNIFNRLETLSEYIDDTEDFINIVQDKHRNQLLQLELIITAGTFALTIVAVVSGIFGMNLDNTFSTESSTPFILVTCMALFIAAVVLVIILWFCRMKGLMSI